jgi:hypothetical protein
MSDRYIFDSHAAKYCRTPEYPDRGKHLIGAVDPELAAGAPGAPRSSVAARILLRRCAAVSSRIDNPHWPWADLPGPGAVSACRGCNQTRVDIE